MEYSIDLVRKCICSLGQALVSLEKELTELDSKLGDGDLGLSMARGGEALCYTVENSRTETLDGLFLECAAAFNQAAPSTLGTLLSMGLRAAGKSLTGCTCLTEMQIVKLPRIMADEIAARGKARIGDKTILDALLPYAERLEAEYQEHGDLARAAAAASTSAVNGAQGTAGMSARIGRARWLGDRNSDYPDGGAVLCSRIAEFFAGIDLEK